MHICTGRLTTSRSESRVHVQAGAQVINMRLERGLGQRQLQLTLAMGWRSALVPTTTWFVIRYLLI